MMTPYKNLRHSAMTSFPNPDEAAAEGALADSLKQRMRDYQQRFRAKRRVHNLLLRVFGRRYRYGCTRAVVLTSTFAYKVPRFDSGFTIFLMGWLANRNEASKWRQATTLYVRRSPLEPHPSTRLAPVRRTWFCGLLLVMVRCQEVTREDGQAYIEAQALQLTEEPELAFDWDYWCGDFHPANLGRYQGRMVCLDYDS